MNPLLKVIGLMSGTSLDGLDIALVEIYEAQNKFHINNTHFKSYSYDNELKEKILKNIDPKTAKIDEISDLNFELGHVFANMVLKFLKDLNLKTEEIDLIGSHGQTFYHNVKNNKAISTLQLAEPAIIALKTGITTVADFRPFDIAVEGHGAPLVPFFDKLLFCDSDKKLVLQNIGGISNLSYLSKDSPIIAFDSGPGNMIIDDLVKRFSNNKLSFDEDGKWAAKGKINNFFLEELLSNDYFKLNPPKSTGRELFGHKFSEFIYEKSLKQGISSEDILATVTFFTAKTIFDSYKNFLPVMPDEVVVSGGGARNKTLLGYLKDLLPKTTELSTLEKYGIISDAKEAVAFAVLAYCSVFGITNNLPSATGAIENVVMGKICPSKNFSRVLLKKNSTDKNIETTENRNLLSKNLDELSTLEIVELMNKGDYDVLQAIENSKSEIAEVIQEVINTFNKEGKLFYTGAGTSGRLGVLDASECPPTFKADPQKVQGIIAGGNIALTSAVEGAEDSGETGALDVKNKVTEKDILVGISANGKAPYVLEGLRTAKSLNAKTALITCNKIEKPEFIDKIIFLDVGAEILSGSTRLKAGTATKMVLNMLTTGAFSKTGKVYGNYMVDVKVSNKKLKRRAVNMVMSITNINEIEAEKLLEASEGSVKHSILMSLKKVDYQTAKSLLEKHKGFLRMALN